jgi:hypothetical protein
MARRTLKASEQGIQAIKKALRRKPGGQTYIASVAGCARQTIGSLLKGNAVDAETFVAVCNELDLDREKIVQVEPPEPQASPETVLETLVLCHSLILG